MPKQTIREWVLENIDIDTVRQVVEHGLASGCVSDLIYYSDTVEFHDKHEDEIWEILYEDARDQGMTVLELIASFNGQKNVGSMMELKNLLTWYAVERTCFNILETE